MAESPLAMPGSDGRKHSPDGRSGRWAAAGRVAPLAVPAGLRVPGPTPECARDGARRPGRSRALERTPPPGVRACSVRLSAATADPGAAWTTERARPVAARRTGRCAVRTPPPGG